MVTLFDLVTRDDLRPSPFCWRAKLALKHKRVPYEARATLYSEIPKLGDGSFKTLPVIEDCGSWSGGSFKIAVDLEARYPDGPTLFPDDPQRRFVEFVESYVDTAVHPQIFPQVALSIWKQLPGSEQDYFRTTRERRLGMSLEEAHRQAGSRLAAIRASFDPMRRILKQRPFLSGDGPAYSDYMVFGALKWQRSASEVALLEAGDPLLPWFEKIDALAGS
jgi:glutathione S-transferase